ncbi:MAG: MBL fold metallo-hydrolase [Candidatus Eisenbacteria bacterium]
MGLTIRAIAITHDHPDHTNGNQELVELTGAEVWLHARAAGNGDRAVKDGETIDVGSLAVKVIHTPGHTPDSVCYLVGDHLVSGDTLFVGKVGGTGYGTDAKEEFDSLHDKLMRLPDHVAVWPGHDYGVRPSSTIGEERKTNPFLVQPDFASFVNLKKNWLQYKKEHGTK